MAGEEIKPVDIYDISGQKPVLGTVDPSEVEAAVKSGQYSLPKGARVPVINPDGQEGDIDAAEAPQAFNQGYSYATPEALKTSEFSTTEQKIKTGLEGAAKGLLGPVATAAEVGWLGVKPENIRARAEANPVLHGATELGGFVGSALVPFGQAKVLSKIGEGAAILAGPTSRLGAGMLRGAVEVGAMAAGDEFSKSLLQDPAQTVGSVAADIGLSTVLGGGLGMISPLWKAFNEGPLEKMLNLIKSDSEYSAASNLPINPEAKISPVLKKALTVFGGVAPENIEAYLSNSDAIKSAPIYEDLYNHSLEHVQKINQNLEEAKSSLSEAKSAYKELHSNVTQAFKEDGFEAKLAAQAAKEALKGAQLQVATEAQSNAISKAPAIANAVESLRSQVIDGSKAAYDVLEKSGKQVSLRPLYTAAKELQDKVFAEGSPMATQQAENISKYVENLGAQYGEKVDAPFAKSIIQGLDKLSKWNFNASQFENGLSPIYKQLRHVLDGTLKETVPEYASAMKPVANKTELLSGLKNYGTQEDAVKSILRLKSPANYTNEMPILRDLEQEVGMKFTHDLDPYASRKIRELKMSAIPEYSAAEKTAKAMEYYKHPASLETLEQSLQHEPEYANVLESQKSLEEAKTAKKELGGISEGSLQGKMNAAMSGRSIYSREALDKIPGLEGMSVPEILDLIKVRQAFERGATNGSRNVNLFGSLGAAAGAMMGGTFGAAALGAGGATLGAFVDKEGPAMVKKFLDKYIAQSHFGDLPKALGVNQESAEIGLKHILGNEAEPNAMAFKGTVDYMKSAMAGIKMTQRAAKALFVGGAAILPPSIIPKDEDIKKLDKQLKHLHENQTKLFNVTGKLDHYLPNHAVAVSELAAKSVNLANMEKPQNIKRGPLDSDIPLSAHQKMEWNRTLSVAQQPLMILQHVKDGTLLPKDVQTVKALYPSFYQKMAQETFRAMADHVSKGENIPYRMRQSLSLFLGEPLDSTFTPESIMSSQGTFIMKKMAAAQTQMPGQKGGKSKLSKVSDQYRTSEQGAIARQSKV